ncbi:MAG: aminotransferase class IV [Bacteroidetes bacterium MedPE-SWsnd-G2]|nr:MAG: aminotransferase class IV [Bacteroidetes bacterium MedPE-SWsnd-G2]
MVNINGKLVLPNAASLDVNNRGYQYGDALFETIKSNNGKLLFWEDHYFRLMASMRILRMEIPMSFTMEYLQEQMESTIKVNGLMKSPARVRLTVDRKIGGKYSPETNDVNFIIQVENADQELYQIYDTPFRVDLYKDFFIAPNLLSGMKSNNKAINVISGIYAKENNWDSCLLLNTNKMVVESISGNFFLVKGNVIKTPPLTDGCLKGVMRKQIIDIIGKWEGMELVEESISPFEIQKADECFVTNVIKGIQPITNYRKKQFNTEVSKTLLDKLNVRVRLSS